MRKSVTSIILASMIAVLGFGFLAVNTYAEEGDNNTESSETAETPKTSLTLMPVSRTLQISSNSTYDGTLTVTNDGSPREKKSSSTHQNTDISLPNQETLTSPPK